MALNKQDLLTAIEAETDSTQLALLSAKLDVVQNLLNNNFRSIDVLVRAKSFAHDSELVSYLDSQIQKIQTEIANLTSSTTQ